MSGQGDIGGQTTADTKPIEVPAVSEWGWAGEMAANNLRTLAPVGLELWRRGADWVDRRVETIELLDVDTVRIRLSVDFRIPEGLPGSIHLGGGRPSSCR